MSSDGVHSDVLAAYASYGVYDDGDFELISTVSEGVSADAIATTFPEAAHHPDLISLWTSTSDAQLFEDVEFHAYGLHLLGPEASKDRTAIFRNKRADDHRPCDIVVGELLDEPELLLYCPEEPASRRYLIALPHDSRDAWLPAGASISEVLARYLAARGEKYWQT